MAARPTFYEILNVSPSAEPAVIEAAYRALMKKYHPDQGTGADGGRSATEINAAYAVLKDPERRARYDEREFARQQSIAIAHYTPHAPPPQRRQLHLFGWSGWAVALGLGGFIAATGGQITQRPSPRAEATGIAAAAQRGQTSQPEAPKAPVGAFSDQDMRILAAAVEAEQRAEARAEPQADAEPAPVPPPMDIEEKPRRAEGREAPRQVAKPKAARQTRKSEEKDFLEREGYIY